MSEPRTVVVYSRKGCHLCEVVKESLGKLSRRGGFTWQEIDVDTDSDLRRQFNDEAVLPFDSSSSPVATGTRPRSPTAGENSSTSYSHSMVPGGLLVMSSTTRLTSATSFVMRVEMRSCTS